MLSISGPLDDETNIGEMKPVMSWPSHPHCTQSFCSKSPTTRTYFSDSIFGEDVPPCPDPISDYNMQCFKTSWLKSVLHCQTKTAQKPYPLECTYLQAKQPGSPRDGLSAEYPATWKFYPKK